MLKGVLQSHQSTERVEAWAFERAFEQHTNLLCVPIAIRLLGQIRGLSLAIERLSKDFSVLLDLGNDLCIMVEMLFSFGQVDGLLAL